MNQQQYQEIVEKNKVRPRRFKHFLFSFLVGGTMGLLAHGFFVLAQEVLKLTKEDAGMVSSLCIVFLTVILTMFGAYKKIAIYAGAGLFIPTSGFANSIASWAIESRFEGPVFGIGSRMFSLAGSVITYGFFGAFLYGCIRLILSTMGVAL